ncbi:MAG TPA: hypothetical protein VFN76_09875 [Candidatus Limnocylindria bacterium]|nr:hypothetical protein [Candidatus Limnocylindria bacterium]
MSETNYPPITLDECDSFERHAETGATHDPTGEGVEYALIQPYDLVRFCHTVRALLQGRVVLAAERIASEKKPWPGISGALREGAPEGFVPEMAEWTHDSATAQPTVPDPDLRALHVGGSVRGNTTIISPSILRRVAERLQKAETQLAAAEKRMAEVSAIGLLLPKLRRVAQSVIDQGFAWNSMEITAEEAPWIIAAVDAADAACERCWYPAHKIANCPVADCPQRHRPAVPDDVGVERLLGELAQRVDGVRDGLPDAVNAELAEIALCLSGIAARYAGQPIPARVRDALGTPTKSLRYHCDASRTTAAGEVG